MGATAGVGGYEWWQYVIVPFMAGTVGWFTNVLALEMTFRPIEFFGFELFRIKGQPWGFFGWQGIIPSKAEKMATICVTLMTEQLFDIKELFTRLKPDKFYTALEDGLILMIDQIIKEISEEYMPSTWYYLPDKAKTEVVVMANKACPDFLTRFIADMQANILNVLDINQMAVNACLTYFDGAILMRFYFLLNQFDVLPRISQEFAFIRKSGFYFGFLFGCVQMGILFGYDEAWVFPVSGFVVGWLTNFLALKCIFKPLKPYKCGPFTIHGLFLKRQVEVAETFARVICQELITTDKMWECILNGPKHKNFEVLLRRHTIIFTDKVIGGLRPIALKTLGADKFAMMKEDVAGKVIKMLPSIIDLSYIYTTEALNLEKTISEEMKKLSSEEFEGVLHPAFEEDEVVLIILGAILGALVGVIQIFIFT